MTRMRILDKSKRSNIKCRNCKWYTKSLSFYTTSFDPITYCKCETSPHYKGWVNYWNICKKFEWREDIGGQDGESKTDRQE